jgi:DNA-3-methyladenine glycosylase
MFGPPGYVYVYLIYGVYFCLNIVTEDLGDPGAVLIRGVVTPQSHLNGPGKICREFGITKEFNGLNLSESAVMSVMPGKCSEPFYATPRIGIRKAQDKLWRFVLPVSHQQVS